MVHAAVVPLPTQNAVAEHKFDFFALAFDRSSELIQILKKGHRVPGRSLVFHPAGSLRAPSRQSVNALRILLEPNNDGASLFVRYIPRRLDSDFAGKLLPAALEPRCQNFWRRWTASQP